MEHHNTSITAGNDNSGLRWPAGTQPNHAAGHSLALSLTRTRTQITGFMCFMLSSQVFTDWASYSLVDLLQYMSGESLNVSGN